MKTETQDRFEYELKRLNNKMNDSQLVFKDAIEIINLANNLLLRYEEIRISRDEWKTKYQTLKRRIIG